MDGAHIYDDVKDDIKFLTSSKIRGMVLLAVLDGKKVSGEISKETGIDVSSVIHVARELEKRGCITDNNGYVLTPKGKILAINLLGFVKTLKTVSMNGFWQEHYIEDIPPPFLSRIYKLYNSEIMKDTPTELMKGFMLYLKLLKKSKDIKGISSIFHPRFPGIIEKLAKRSARMEFIITPSVMEKLREKRMRKRLIEIMRKENFSLHLIEKEIKLAFTVTESFLSFTLYFKNGLFDDNATLISHDENAIEWANSLFEYYLDLSKPLSPSDF